MGARQSALKTQHAVTGVGEDGMRWVRSFRLVHPARHQRVFVVSVPRFALKTFYRDWVYVPYVKENALCTSMDLDSPPFYERGGGNLVLRRRPEEYGEYDSFQSINMPDPAEAGVTRRENHRRESVIFCTLPRFLYLTTNFKDRHAHYKYVRRGILKLVGPGHMYHPGKDTSQSFVVLLPPLQTNAALNVLEEQGFEITEAVEHVVGEEAKLALLHKCGIGSNLFVVAYIYMLMAVLLYKIVEVANENAAKNEAEFKEFMAKARGEDIAPPPPPAADVKK